MAEFVCRSFIVMCMVTTQFPVMFIHGEWSECYSHWHSPSRGRDGRSGQEGGEFIQPGRDGLVGGCTQFSASPFRFTEANLSDTQHP